jgi:hypothetical protein
MNKPSGPPPHVRAAEITKLLARRYPSLRIRPDDLGRDRLRALLDHLLLAGDGRRMRRVLAGWAPWLTEDQANELFERCAAARQTWGSDELGTLFGLTVEERADLKITSIRPAGYSDADMKVLERARKAKYSRGYRQRLAIQARGRSREAADDAELTERDKAIFAQTLPSWRSTTDIAKDLRAWPEFKKLDFGSIRKAAIRSCKTLEASRWIEVEMRSGTRRQKLLFVRRRAAVHGVFVSETPGHREKPSKTESLIRTP